MKTFYWYDYETFGISPRVSRIAQFAGIRTDENFNVLDEHMFYCKPSKYILPDPQACAVTGITPQLCEQKGLIEHEFIKKINEQFSQPETCVVGYNNIRFDDEFTRHTLYRNFIDPYAWHWRNNNSRWDLLDVVRMSYALKKNASLNWVYDDAGNPSFKLDKLAPANGIEHSNAHDALADVYATIAIAKILKKTQPKMFDFALALRNKNEVEQKIQFFEPMLHTSRMYPASLSCTRLVTPVCYHPDIKGKVLLFNLDQDPSIVIDTDIEKLQTLAFTRVDELPEGSVRLQIKALTFNKSPMFVPNVRKLGPEITKQLNLDMDTCLKHLDYIRERRAEFADKVKDIYRKNEPFKFEGDVDQALYDGFVGNSDRDLCDRIQKLTIEQLKAFTPSFKDKRLTRLLMMFKGENYPESLSETELKDWNELVRSRVVEGKDGFLSIESYVKSIADMRAQQPDKESLWIELGKYAQSSQN